MLNFRLYIGLKDKNTKEQEITTTKANGIITKYVIDSLGYVTITQGKGIYTHENGKDIVIENTIIVEYTTDNETDGKKVKKLVERLKMELNQESIFLSVCKCESKFL